MHSDKNRLGYFKIMLETVRTDADFEKVVRDYDETDIKFIFYAKKTQEESIYKKDLVAYYHSLVSGNMPRCEIILKHSLWLTREDKPNLFLEAVQKKENGVKLAKMINERNPDLKYQKDIQGVSR